MTDPIATLYLDDIRRTYRKYKKMGDKAIAQVSRDADLYEPLDDESNSIAIIVKHLGGNLRSRFTDFLTTDGEKPDRDRDAEFEMGDDRSRSHLLAQWDAAWATAFASLDALTPADLERTVTIRQESFSVVGALNRLATHVAYHIGQIVLLAKHATGPTWTSLSIPKRR